MVKLHKIGKYQHYKGGIYEVLGVADPLGNKPLPFNILTIAKHTERENDNDVVVYYAHDGKWYVKEKESHVIYKSDETGVIWARPHDMFMEYVKVWKENLQFGFYEWVEVPRFRYIGD